MDRSLIADPRPATFAVDYYMYSTFIEEWPSVPQGSPDSALPLKSLGLRQWYRKTYSVISTQPEINWALSCPICLTHAMPMMPSHVTLPPYCLRRLKSLTGHLDGLVNRLGPPILMPPRWHDVTADSPRHTYPNRVRSSLSFPYPRFLSGSVLHRLGAPESTLLLTSIIKTAMQKFTCRDGTGRYDITLALPVQHSQT